MKREIKFRGKRIDNNEWVYGYYVIDQKGQHRIYCQPFCDATSNTYHFVKEDTIGQLIYTHETNDIYEGDIIRQYNHDSDEWSEGELKFCDLDMRWVIGEEQTSFYKYHNPTVIGNIHE